MSNKYKDQTFLSQSGITAEVRRQERKDVELDQRQSDGNGLLRVIGKDYLHPHPAQREALEYVGSAAVHVYVSPVLKQYFYVSQVLMSEVPEVMASQAMTDLRGSLMTSYGRKRPTKRSGI